MRLGLEDRIREKGYWRVNIRPIVPIESKLTLGRSREIVERASVNLRGWDFPHVSPDDQFGGNLREDNFIENWCEWNHHIEFWRMYTSTQFLHYKALWDDHHSGGSESYGAPILDILGAVFTLTEIAEFTFNLNKQGIYKEGATIIVTLGNTSRRRLFNSESLRVAFFDAKITNASSVKIEETVPPERFSDGPAEVSAQLSLKLFDKFGWNPEKSQISSYQERLYSRSY